MLSHFSLSLNEMLRDLEGFGREAVYRNANALLLGKFKGRRVEEYQRMGISVLPFLGGLHLLLSISSASGLGTKNYGWSRVNLRAVWKLGGSSGN